MSEKIMFFYTSSLLRKIDKKLGKGSGSGIVEVNPKRIKTSAVIRDLD